MMEEGEKVAHMQQLPSPASVFCFAAPSDSALLAEWERHLKLLVQARHITLWSERHLMAGTPRMQQIYDHLNHANLIILLLSAAFFDEDECVGLMERAIERAERIEVRLIPLLLRPVAWRESPLAPFPCMPSNNRPVTEWSNRDAAFDACVRDIRRLLGRPVSAPLTYRHTRTEPAQNQNRMRMLRRVRAIWIDGLLMQSLHDAARIELHLQDRPDVLETPLRFQVQELNQAPKALPDGTTIVHVYDKAEGELLLLGEPGSGKTTLLLELTATLLERAERDEQLPIPVIFNLSSWAEKREPLHVWLIEELRRIYQVPRKIGKAWIDADHVLPLLDGLDEVAKDARSGCVEQINAYYQSRLECGSSPIVVCCRSEEYVSLSTRVVLQHSVSILPLTDTQINTYLEQAGEQVRGLRQALSEETELHNLARQPLMLNIFTLAYQEAQASDVPIGETREEMRRTIFARYVERMLRRRGQSKSWKPEQVIYWLTFLAKQMQQHGQSIFLVESLQPNWLSGKLKALYHWCCTLPIVPISILAGMLIESERIDNPLPIWTGLVMSLAVGLIVGLFVGLSNRIEPVEVLIWSWKRARSMLGIVLPAGLGEGLIVTLLQWQKYGLLFALVNGLAGMLVMWLGIGWWVGSSRKQLPGRLSPSPNRGIWDSCKNGLGTGLFGGLLGGVIGGPGGILLGGTCAGLYGGLSPCVRHFTLRFWLWQSHQLPWNLIPFLDEATERLLLHKVGGSYIFVHRQLRDYFASLDESRLRSIE